MKTKSEITLLLIEAQRGLMAAQSDIASAIEEINCPTPPLHRDSTRYETALERIGHAVSMNSDFTLYARRSIIALLDTLAPDPVKPVMTEGVSS